MKKMQIAMICAAMVMFSGIGTSFAQGLAADDDDHPLPQCRVWVNVEFCGGGGAFGQSSI